MNIILSPASVRDVWEIASAWLDEYGRVAVATVLSTWGSAPVPAGGQLVATVGDRFEGSVSGGCVEADVLVEAAEAMESGRAKILEFGVSDDDAWRAGLPCGGRISVLVEPFERRDARMLADIIEARRARRPVVRTTRIEDVQRQLYTSAEQIPATFSGCLASGKLHVVETENGAVAVQPIVPPLHVIVAGATHIGQIFGDMARQAGYQVSVVDPRGAFLTEERFGTTMSANAWPATAFDGLGLDERTAVVALTHTAHIDDEALGAALRSPACYIGALGSRATHAKRLDRLKAAGFTDAELARIHAPIGLPIGAKGAAEIAVSILAQIIQVNRSGS